MFRTLVLSGGSTKGVGLLGALYHLNERFDLAAVEAYYATSVGAIAAVLLALGFSPSEMFFYFIQFRFAPLLDVSRENIQLLDFARFQEYMTRVVRARHAAVPTLGELAARGKSLFLIAYNYSKNKMEILSPDSHPDMPCVTAMSLSSALPVIFGLKTQYGGDYYFDGGLVCNFPLDVAVERRARDILAINIRSAEVQSSEDPPHVMILNLMFVSIQSQVERVVEMYGDRCTLLELAFSIPFTRFNLGVRECLEHFLVGFWSAREILAKKIPVQ